MGNALSMGYDSVKLDDNWIVFDPDRIAVVDVEDTSVPRRAADRKPKKK